MSWTSQELDKLNLVKNSDGSFRAKTREEKEGSVKPTPMLDKALNQATQKEPFDHSKGLRKLSLCLFGEPMPKQSVRSFASGAKSSNGKFIVSHYQPSEMGKRVKDYQAQIKKQLPPDFEMFTEIVHIRKMHFIFCPLKSFGKCKMDKIARGEIFYKTTKPDLPDNSKKLPLDAMSGLVYKDDALIATENDVAKYYGTGGMILIEFEGY